MFTYTVLIDHLTSIMRWAEKLKNISVKTYQSYQYTYINILMHRFRHISICWLNIIQLWWLEELGSPKFNLVTNLNVQCNCMFLFDTFSSLISTWNKRLVPNRERSMSRLCIVILFNLYAEYIMRNAGLDEAQAGIKIAGKNINNFRYANDTILWQKVKN